MKIPYISASSNACALACYTMTAKYFFSESTFEQISKISDWEPNYVVWPFKFWAWIMNRGIKITDYDLIDYEGWANKGVKALEKSLSKKEMSWLKKNSKDLDKIGKDIEAVLEHNNFAHKKSKPKLNVLVGAVRSNKICEVVLDSRTLDKREGFSLHRVVVTGITDKEIVFHDPREIPHPNRKETVNHFKKSWLEAVSDPELCIYEK